MPTLIRDGPRKMTFRASVIIPTRNRAEVLEPCLRSLARQTLASDTFEVIVVDNGSTDNTAEVVRQYADVLQLNYVSAPELGLHVGRHAGMQLAQTDLLLFADDDIEADADWVASVIEAFTDTQVGLVGGNNHPLFEQPPPAWLSRWWGQPVAHGRALGHLSILDFGEGQFEIDPGYVWGCNFSIRRDVLLAAGGFHPDAVPRERLRFRGDGETHVSNMVRRSGLRTLFDSRASVHHRVSAARMTPAYFGQRGYSQGISDSYTDIRLMGQPRASASRLAARRMRDWVRRLRLRAMRASDAADAELIKVKLDTLEGYRRGYEFHQGEVQGDPALFAWVMKETYL